ncbi:hypothetical protein D1871_14535 [Nakamurella silvestris]|nr:hypothetical protein D1871_14535 [Nakamurella silvestris]
MAFVEGPRNPDQVAEILDRAEQEILGADDARRKQLAEELDSLAEDLVGQTDHRAEVLKRRVQAILGRLAPERHG